ncbi:hypothetical protein BU16DRAFT_562474 [Lophium mytilinum]|uniref:AB hydrolase-1 domain-containing protein n=1 Tax=Lophium mytilinum TaxID=390894 RepID=A0A6A6QRT3_9PEZI|nr:hypothetical protein BU16DRAFT_562474 [Lophium mytilinum]
MRDAEYEIRSTKYGMRSAKIAIALFHHAITELFVEAFQINSTLAEHVVGSQNHVSGTYDIYSQLCFPNGTINATTIQFLIHGAGFDRSYWNVAPGYSYVDYAAEKGYTTSLYDRLGVGLSDHPDPIQTVQVVGIRAPAHPASAHRYQTNGVTTLHPDDFDAAVLTGFSPDMSGVLVAFAGSDLAIASQKLPLRLSGLPNGYLTTSSIEGTQQLFFRAPGFDPTLLNIVEATKQTITLGEFFTSAPKVAAKFTGPIDVVNGENDLPNCHGNCLVPYNKAAAVKDMFYPAASNGSSWFLAAGAGHGLNLHYAAPAAYEHIHNFIKANGF